MEALLKLGIFLMLAFIGYWRGRRNEQRHLQDILLQEQRLAHITVFSSRYPPVLQQAMDPVLVTGSTVVGSDFFRMLIAALRKVVGGNHRAYESLLERGRRQALVRLKQAADAQGARMVFNVKFSTARISDWQLNEAPQLEILACGTAFVPAAGCVADSTVHHRFGGASAFEEPEDLLKNRASRLWLVGWLFTVLACLVALVADGHLQHSWRYADGAPWWAFFVLSGVATATIARKARQEKLSLGANVALSVLSVPTLAVVLYFSALHLNAWTAQPQVVLYTAKENGVLHPQVQGSGPTLVFPDVVEYWQAYPADATASITLAKGWLGFYQYDLKPLRADYDGFYRNRSEKRPQR